MCGLLKFGAYWYLLFYSHAWSYIKYWAIVAQHCNSSYVPSKIRASFLARWCKFLAEQGMHVGLTIGSCKRACWCTPFDINYPSLAHWEQAKFWMLRLQMAEFCRSDYEPSEINILRTEGLSQGSGLVEIEITLDDDTCSWRHVNICSGLDR